MQPTNSIPANLSWDPIYHWLWTTTSLLITVGALVCQSRQPIISWWRWVSDLKLLLIDLTSTDRKSLARVIPVKDQSFPRGGSTELTARGGSHRIQIIGAIDSRFDSSNPLAPAPTTPVLVYGGQRGLVNYRHRGEYIKTEVRGPGNQNWSSPPPRLHNSRIILPSRRHIWSLCGDPPNPCSCQHRKK